MLELGVHRQPDLAEPAGSELLLEPPAGAARDRLAERRPPAGLLEPRRLDPPRLRRALGLRERREARDADLEHLARSFDALELVEAVGFPFQLVAAGARRENGPRQVEGAARHQDLPLLRQAHHASGGVDLGRHERSGAALGVGQRDLAHVDADPRVEPLGSAELREPLLEGERAVDRVRWHLEGREEAVAQVVLLAPLETAEAVAEERVVALDRLHRHELAEAALQVRRADEIGEEADAGDAARDRLVAVAERAAVLGREPDLMGRAEAAFIRRRHGAAPVLQLLDGTRSTHAQHLVT